MQTDKEFEDFFRERLNGLEETPPFNAWEKIKEDIKPPRKYYREMAAVALLFLISACLYLGLRTGTGETARPETELVQHAENAAKKQAAATQTFPETAKETAAERSIKSNAASQSSGETQKTAQPETSSLPSGEIGGHNFVSKPSTGNKPSGADLAIALVKKDKSRKVRSEARPTETTRIMKAETALAFNAKTARTAAFSTEKRYGSEARNAAATLTDNAEKEAVSTKEMKQNATAANEGILAETNVANAQNGSLKEEKTETVLAHNAPVKTDSVALPTIPELLADSANAAEKEVAKTNPKTKSEAGKFAVTVNFTPGIIARRLVANPTDDQYLRFTEGEGDKTNLGFDVSTTVHHRISPKTTIDGGFSYTKLHSNVNYQISKGHLNVIVAPVQGNPSTPVAVNYNFADEEFKNEFAYAGLRVGLSQDLVRTKAHAIFVSGGAGLNKLLSNSGTLSTTQTTKNGISIENKEVTNAFHTVNSHVYLSAGLEKMVMPKVSILVAPAFTYYLNSALQKKHIFEMKPYTIGLNFGLRYQL